jgi:hypothetical protein
MLEPALEGKQKPYYRLDLLRQRHDDKAEGHHG